MYLAYKKERPTGVGRVVVDTSQEGRRLPPRHRLAAVEALVAIAVTNRDVSAVGAGGRVGHLSWCCGGDDRRRCGAVVDSDVREVGAVEVVHAEDASQVVDDTGRDLDVLVAVDASRRLEAREGKLVDEGLDRHAVLQGEREGDSEAAQERAKLRRFAMHVDEDLAERAVVVLAGADEDLVAGDARFLREAVPSTREPLTIGRSKQLQLFDALCDLVAPPFIKTGFGGERGHDGGNLGIPISLLHGSPRDAGRNELGDISPRYRLYLGLP